MPTNSSSSSPAEPKQTRCPGWPHDHDFNQCDADKAVHRWVTNRRETTHAEREKKRHQVHEALGLIEPTPLDELFVD